MPIVHVSTHAEFTKTINGSKPVVVDFHATWCGPCKQVAPRFEKLSNEVPQVIFLKVDVDQQQSIAKECSVTAMPTFQFFKSGQKIDEVVGADIVKVERLVKKYAAGSTGGFPATGGRVLGSGAAASAPGQGVNAQSYLKYGLMVALVAYLWWTKNDPALSGAPR